MSSNVSAPLPQVTLLPGSTVTVTAGTAGAIVSSMIVHGFQIRPPAPASSPLPLLVRRSGR